MVSRKGSYVVAARSEAAAVVVRDAIVTVLAED
jgi:hypothetical protein